MNYFFAGKPAVEASFRHRLTSPAENASFEYGIRPPADESKDRYAGRAWMKNSAQKTIRDTSFPENARLKNDPGVTLN
jgi:hypothetical protein